MSESRDEVVRVARGELVQIEMYQSALAEVGIESKVAGTDLGASFGSALTGTIELYVREVDAAKAEDVLRSVEATRGMPPAE